MSLYWSFRMRIVYLLPAENLGNHGIGSGSVTEAKGIRKKSIQSL